MPKNKADMEFFYCEIKWVYRTTLLTFFLINKILIHKKTSINWIWRKTLTTAAFNSAVMIKSDNKIYQDMVRGMMGLQVPSGGSVAFATESGPEGQDDQGKVRWIIFLSFWFPGIIDF